MFYSAIRTEILRIAKANNNASSFCLSVNPLIFRMIIHHAHNDKLINPLMFQKNRHFIYFQDKAEDVEEHLSLYIYIYICICILYIFIYILWLTGFTSLK